MDKVKNLIDQDKEMYGIELGVSKDDETVMMSASLENEVDERLLNEKSPKTTGDILSEYLKGKNLKISADNSNVILFTFSENDTPCCAEIDYIEFNEIGELSIAIKEIHNKASVLHDMLELWLIKKDPVVKILRLGANDVNEQFVLIGFSCFTSDSEGTLTLRRCL